MKSILDHVKISVCTIKCIKTLARNGQIVFSETDVRHRRGNQIPRNNRRRTSKARRPHGPKARGHRKNWKMPDMCRYWFWLAFQDELLQAYLCIRVHLMICHKFCVHRQHDRVSWPLWAHRIGKASFPCWLCDKDNEGAPLCLFLLL